MYKHEPVCVHPENICWRERGGEIKLRASPLSFPHPPCPPNKARGQDKAVSPKIGLTFEYAKNITGNNELAPHELNAKKKKRKKIVIERERENKKYLEWMMAV